MKQFLLTGLLCLMAAAFALAQRSITGKVSDQNGDPLIGATVLLKNTKSGAVTDGNGQYSLNAPGSSGVLVFSFSGFKTAEIDLAGRTSVDAVLTENPSVLDEVVVIGYGKQIRSTTTSNIARLGNENLRAMPVVSLEQAMQGQAAGVNIETVNGKLGAAARVRIRGVGSINAGTEPLFVIDGIPISKSPRNTYGGPLNPLADINFNDIESINVLKDAAAKAIYGSRGSNGVVLITTKSGKSGKTKIEFDIQYGGS